MAHVRTLGKNTAIVSLTRGEFKALYAHWENGRGVPGWLLKKEWMLLEAEGKHCIERKLSRDAIDQITCADYEAQGIWNATPKDISVSDSEEEFEVAFFGNFQIPMWKDC